jgi:hypothetical protein
MRWTFNLVFELVPGRPIEQRGGGPSGEEKSFRPSVGLTIAEGKALLASLQEQSVTVQIEQYVASMKLCSQCGDALKTEGH